MPEMRLAIANYCDTSDYIILLSEAGFTENFWGKNFPLDPRHEEIRAIKTWHNKETHQGIACVVEHIYAGKGPFKDHVEFYTYEGHPDAHRRIQDVPDYSDYIKEMVDKGVIEFV